MSSARQRPPLEERVLPSPPACTAARSGLAPFSIVRGMATGLGYGVHGAALLLLTLALALGLGGGGLAWRLGQRPLDVTAFARWIAVHKFGQDPAISLDRATIAWSGFAGGSARALHLDLKDVALTQPDQVPATIRHAALDLSVPALIRGEALPRRVLLQGVRATVPFGHGPAPGDPAPSMQTVLRDLARPDADADPSDAAPALLRELQSVVMEDVELTWAGNRPGDLIGTGRAQGEVRLNRASAGGVEGAARVYFSLGTISADADLHAAASGSGTRLDLTVTPVDLAALGAAAPAFARIGLLQAPLGGHMVLDLSPELLPRSLAIEARAGAGWAMVQGVGLPFESFSLAGTAAWTPDSRVPAWADISLGTLTFRSPSTGQPSTVKPSTVKPSIATVSAHTVRTGDGLRSEGTVTLDRLALADLGPLWPEKFGGHARPWLVENLTAGTVHNGRATFIVEAGADGAHPKLTGFTAGLMGDDVSIHWLRPVPPVEHVQAVLSMTKPDVLEITASSGRQGAARMQNALIRITGLAVKDQDMSVATEIESSVPDLLPLLKHPRLHLLSDHPIPVQHPEGSLAGTLNVTFPLEHDLQFEQVGIYGKGRLAGLRLGGIVAGRDLERGEISFDVSQDGLHAEGPASVAGFQSNVTVAMDFTHGGSSQVTQHATAVGRATKAQLAAGGFDPGAFMPSGSVSLAGDYTEHQDGKAEVVLKADLREATLAGAGWKKVPGAPGQAAGRLQLLHGHLVSIDELRAEAPGLRVEGRAELAGGEPSGLVLNLIEIGPIRARGEVRLAGAPGGPVRLTLSGPVLDLSSLFGSGRTSAPGTGGAKRMPFLADLAFEKVLLARQRAFTQVKVHAEHDGTRLKILQFQTGGPEAVLAEIGPMPGGRRVSLRAQDAGAVFSAMDVTGSIVGGSLAIDGQFDDRQPSSPLIGTLNLTDLHVQDAPAVGKLLQAVSLFGLPEALDGPGLKLNRVRAPFEWSNDDLYLGESEAYSASLGLTAKGHFDLGRHTLDVAGTVVPLYAINSVLGRVPLVGRLFSPERGGGLFSLSYGLHGASSDPSVAVNPLSILTPGLARRLFRLFD